MRTECKNCKGWYNSCSPDWYPDYINDPEDCEYFEIIDSPTSDNNKYTSSTTPKSIN